MSSGKDHARASKFLALPVAVASFAVVDDPVLALGAVLGCGIVGQVLSPDLDQSDLTRSDWLVLKRAGVFGGLWLAWLYPYAVAIPHRHPLSHAPVVGTVGRVLYVTLPFLVGARLLDWSPVIPAVVVRLLVGVFFGLLISDVAHWAMDQKH